MLHMKDRERDPREGELERELNLRLDESYDYPKEGDPGEIDYLEDLKFIEDQIDLLSFKQFSDEEDTINEKLGYGGIVKTSSILILMRLKSLQSKIKNEKDLEKKINFLGVQNLYLGSLTTLGLSVDIKDKSLIGRSRKFVSGGKWKF